MAEYTELTHTTQENCQHQFMDITAAVPHRAADVASVYQCLKCRKVQENKKDANKND